MKPSHLLIPAFFLIAGLIVEFGCIKGGPLLPYDLPLPTPTPVSGAIEAGVVDNGLPVSGVTVWAVDPNGDTLTAVTDTFGKVAYDPNPLLIGNWVLKVPTQDRYFLSTLPLTVTGGGGYGVTFVAGGQTIQVTPTTAETYGSSNTPIGYVVTYNQPYNLSVPVSLSTSNDLPGSWGKNFQPVVLGAGVNSSNVTITKTGCYISKFSYLFQTMDFLGIQTSTQSATISRGFTIPALVNLIGTVTNNNQTAVYQFTIGFSVSNDCNNTYSLRTVVRDTDGPATIYNNTQNFINGQSQTVNVQGGSYFNYSTTAHIDLTLTAPTTVITGTFAPTASFNTNVINSSY